jgi:hypothetical protein
MMFKRRSAACPVCSAAVEISKSFFGLDSRCRHCGAALKVSPLYLRILVLFSVVVGYVLAWGIGTYGPRACFGVPWGFYLFWMPLGFLVLSFLVRVAPFLVCPTLVLRHPFESHLTTMNLSSDPKDDHRE